MGGWKSRRDCKESIACMLLRQFLAELFPLNPSCTVWLHGVLHVTSMHLHLHICECVYTCLQKADEEAAKVYEEFVESFKSDETDERGGVKTFVRGGTVAPGSRSTEAVGEC